MDLRSLAVLATACLAVCGSVAAGSPEARNAPAGFVVIPLRATPANAGNVGQVTLLPMGGSATGIRLFFTGVPNATTVPIHLHTSIYEAACDALPSKAAYELNGKVLVSTSA